MLAVEIVFAFFALAFVQLANAQIAGCSDAQSSLMTDATCLAAISAETDVETICMGSCRSLIDDIINNCDAADATIYSTLINNLCNGTNTSGACADAISSISPTCLASLNSSDTSVCTGTCGTQLAAVVTACDNDANATTLIYNLCNGTNTDGICANPISTISPTCLASLNSSDTSVCTGRCEEQFIAVTACNNIGQETRLTLSAYDTLCGVGTGCTVALAAVFADTSCTTALQNEDAGVLCSGSCRSLIDTLFITCPDDDDTIATARVQFKRLCGPIDCTNAISGISSTCSEALSDGHSFACVGVCTTEVELAVNTCNMTNSNDTQTGALLDQYNALCPSACVAAQSALAAETSCRMDDDVAVICSGTCNTLVDAIMNACPLNGTQAGAFLNQYNALCSSACTAAQLALAADTSCRLDDDAAVICSGTCRTLADAVMNACPMNGTQAGAFLNQYNALCSSACTAAQSALAANTSCRLDDDAAVICSGTCRTLADAVMNVCPMSDDDMSEFDSICGSGSIMVMAPGITLLIAVICVLTALH